jgi:hypothetical protein
MTLCLIRESFSASISQHEITYFCRKQMNMTKGIYHIIISSMVLIMIGFSAGNLFAQQGIASFNPSEQRIEMDALALAYGTCKYELARYYHEHDSRKSVSDRELKQVEMTHQEFFVNIRAKYGTDEELLEKFDRKVKNARKKLPTCIRYQQIVDANANIEKVKEVKPR